MQSSCMKREILDSTIVQIEVCITSLSGFCKSVWSYRWPSLYIRFHHPLVLSCTALDVFSTNSATDEASVDFPGSLSLKAVKLFLMDAFLL